MKVEYSRRAISDLNEISTYYKAHAGARVAAAIADRIEAVARYSRWRRAHVEMEIVIPKP